MAERRGVKRTSRRFTIKYGVDFPTNVGFSTDISPTGLFIKTTNVLPVGTPVKVLLSLPKGQEVYLTGKVVWYKKAPAGLDRVILKNGIGISLENPASEYIKFVESLDEDLTKTSPSL
jgi:Tfp pilus assembly protein PilZ